MWFFDSTIWHCASILGGWKAPRELYLAACSPATASPDLTLLLVMFGGLIYLKMSTVCSLLLTFPPPSLSLPAVLSNPSLLCRDSKNGNRKTGWISLGRGCPQWGSVPIRRNLTLPFILLVKQAPQFHTRQLPCCYLEPRRYNSCTDSNCSSLCLKEISNCKQGCWRENLC